MKIKSKINLAKKIFFLTISTLLLLSGCATDELEFNALYENQAYVVQLEPESNSSISPNEFIQLTFSKRIDFNSIGKKSIALVYGDFNDELFNQKKEIQKWLEEHDSDKVELSYLLEGEEKTLNIFLPETLRQGNYTLVVSDELRCVDGLPFNQSPGSGPTAFIANFHYGEVKIEEKTETEEKLVEYEYGTQADILLINEVLYDGKNSETDGEAFIELWGSSQADISDYRILLINGADGQITEEIVLPKNSWTSEAGIFLIADLKTGSKNESQVDSPDYLLQFDPQNGPDSVQLLNRNGELIDILGYGTWGENITVNQEILYENSPAIDVSGGHSLSRSEGIDTDNNYEDFIELEVPTPGIF
ncbi:MAG: lamin tail domain-containing protein [Deltaproteobacteria bacterium]|nr:lamin tail domain-containing protein [Deltaproteobacteria bacterium]